MSLFGDEDSAPSAAVSKSRLSLFDDEPSPAPGSKSSLFADDESTPSSSPWGLPTPKKAARGDLVKNLLPTSDVPDSYIDTFDDVIKAGDGIGGKVTSAAATRVLSAAELGADEQSHIVSIISPGGQLSDLSRNEFNVFLALIGLAQEHEDITLDSVDERRRSRCFFRVETRPMLTELQSYLYQSFRVYQQHLQHLLGYQNLQQSLPSDL
jgi:sorting nexin-8